MAEALIFIYHIFTSLSLFSLGLYHLISAVRSFHKPSPHPHSARPYYPLPRFPSLPFLLSVPSLLLSLLLLLLSFPLFSSLPSSLSLFLFLLLLSLSFLSLLPSDLLFLLSSLSFYLLSLPSPLLSLPSPLLSLDLSSKTNSISSLISLSSAAFSLLLALNPKLFLAEIALSSSLLLKSHWILQTLASLHVDLFVPEGCHRLLDLAMPLTQCDIEQTHVRAEEILDAAFAAHAVAVAAVVVVVYLAVGRGAGGGMRRSNGGSYESLPTVASGGSLADVDHVQMKAIGKSSAQE